MQTRVDVAKIMRDIRGETRALREDILRRIERVHAQLQEKPPQHAQQRLDRLLQTRTEALGRSSPRLVEYPGRQDADYLNLQRMLSDINRLLEDSAPALGPVDRWWHPRAWVKWAMLPIRRFVLRRQNDVNYVMRDTLFCLYGMTDMLIEQLENSRRYMQDWLSAVLPPMVDCVLEQQRRSADEQSAAIAAIREDAQRKMEKFVGDEEVRLGELARAASGALAGKADALTGFDNLSFAESLRGRPEDVRRQQGHYLQYLQGHANILDAGCGRGEFLDLLRDNAIAAQGVDSDENMVKHCRAKGLDVHCADVLEHLAQAPDQSLGGLVAFQLIEHLDFPSLVQLFRLAGRKIRPLGVLILETVNPTCLTTFCGAFYADPTHQKPIHPEAARWMAESSGFADVKIDFLNPVNDSEKLHPLADGAISDPVLRRTVETMNANISLLNSVLYSFADYALIGRKAP